MSNPYQDNTPLKYYFCRLVKIPLRFTILVKKFWMNHFHGLKN